MLYNNELNNTACVAVVLRPPWPSARRRPGGQRHARKHLRAAACTSADLQHDPAGMILSIMHALLMQTSQQLLRGCPPRGPADGRSQLEPTARSEQE